MSAARMALEEDTDKNVSVRRTETLGFFNWNDIQVPGWYMDVRTREAYKFTREALVQKQRGASPTPVVNRVSGVFNGMIQLTQNPDVGIVEVRRIAEKYGYATNF